MLLDRSSRPCSGTAPDDLAALRLVCLVRAGDGYRVRAVNEWGERQRRQLDISFGGRSGSGRSGEVEAAVRHIQRWCDDGTTVALLHADGGLLLRAADGTEVPLP